MEKLKQLHGLLVAQKIDNKSFEEFQTNFSGNPEKQKQLHELLVSKKIDSKPFEEFQANFFAESVAAPVKKKESASALPSQGLEQSPVSGGQQGTVSAPTKTPVQPQPTAKGPVQPSPITGTVGLPKFTTEIPAETPLQPGQGVLAPTEKPKAKKFGDEFATKYNQQPTVTILQDYLRGIFSENLPTENDVNIYMDKLPTERMPELVKKLDSIRKRTDISDSEKKLEAKKTIYNSLSDQFLIREGLANDIAKYEDEYESLNPTEYRRQITKKASDDFMSSGIQDKNEYDARILFSAVNQGVGLGKDLDPNAQEEAKLMIQKDLIANKNLDVYKSNPNVYESMLAKRDIALANFDSQINTLREKRLSQYDDQIDKLSNEIVSNPSNKEAVKQRDELIKNRDKYLDPAAEESKVIGMYKTEIMQQDGLTPREKLKNYYIALEHERRDLESRMPKGAIAQVYQATIGGTAPATDRYNRIVQRMNSIAPVVLFNQKPYEQGIAESTVRQLYDMWGGKRLTNIKASDAQTATDILQSLTSAGIDPSSISKEAVAKLRTETEGYGLSDPRFYSNMFGMLAGVGLQGMAGGAVGKTLTAPKWIASGPRLLKTIYNMAKAGATYEVTGNIFKDSSDEFDFVSGVAGGAAGELFDAGGKISSKLLKNLGLAFGENTPKAVKVITKYGSNFVKGATGETAEETLQDLWHIYRDTGSFKQFSEEHDTWSENLKYFIGISLMGGMMGMSTGLGKDAEKEAADAYSNLSPEEQATAREYMGEALGSIQDRMEEVESKQGQVEEAQQPVTPPVAEEVAPVAEPVAPAVEEAAPATAPEVTPAAEPVAEPTVPPVTAPQVTPITQQPLTVEELDFKGDLASQLEQQLTQQKAQRDQENVQGISGEERIGQEPVQAQPIEGAGTEAVAPGGMVQEQGQEVTPAPKSEAATKRAYDFDDTLYDPKTGKLTPLGEEVKARIAAGEDITIVTARNGRQVAPITKALGISKDKIQATGNEAKKGEVLDKLGIDRNDYYDADQAKMQAIQAKAEPVAEVTQITEEAAVEPAQKPMVEPKAEAPAVTETKQEVKAPEIAVAPAGELNVGTPVTYTTGGALGNVQGIVTEELSADEKTGERRFRVSMPIGNEISFSIVPESKLSIKTDPSVPTERNQVLKDFYAKVASAVNKRNAEQKAKAAAEPVVEAKPTAEKVVPESEKKASPKKVANRIRQAKIDTKGKAFDATIGLPIALYNQAVETVALAVEAGVAIADAIQKGIDLINKSQAGKKWNEAEFRKQLGGLATEPTAKALEEGKAQAEEGKYFNLNGQDTFYHASENKRKGRLRPNKAPQFGVAVYFGTNKDAVEYEFGDENTTQVKLNIKNPLYAGYGEWAKVKEDAITLANEDWLAKNKNKIPNWWDEQEDGPYKEYSDIEEIDSKFISDAAIANGYDAIINDTKGKGEYGDEIAVLDESAIVYPEDLTEPTAQQQPAAEPVGEVKPGVSELFESNPELANIGTPEQYSQYLDTIFPYSKVKEILYHASTQLFDEFRNDIYNKFIFFSRDKNFFPYKYKYPAILDSQYVTGPELAKNPDIIKILKDIEKREINDFLGLDFNAAIDSLNSDSYGIKEREEIRNYLLENYDSYTTREGGLTVAVKSPKQIFRLGTKQDIEGFKKFMSGQPTASTQAPISTVSLNKISTSEKPVEQQPTAEESVKSALDNMKKAWSDWLDTSMGAMADPKEEARKLANAINATLDFGAALIKMGVTDLADWSQQVRDAVKKTGATWMDNLSDAAVGRMYEASKDRAEKPVEQQPAAEPEAEKKQPKKGEAKTTPSTKERLRQRGVEQTFLEHPEIAGDVLDEMIKSQPNFYKTLDLSKVIEEAKKLIEEKGFEALWPKLITPGSTDPVVAAMRMLAIQSYSMTSAQARMAGDIEMANKISQNLEEILIVHGADMTKAGQFTAVMSQFALMAPYLDSYLLSRAEVMAKNVLEQKNAKTGLTQKEMTDNAAKDLNAAKKENAESIANAVVETPEVQNAKVDTERSRIKKELEKAKQEFRNVLANSGKSLNSGINPGQLADFTLAATKLGYYLVLDGAHTLKDFIKKMKDAGVQDEDLINDIWENGNFNGSNIGSLADSEMKKSAATSVEKAITAGKKTPSETAKAKAELRNKIRNAIANHLTNPDGRTLENVLVEDIGLSPESAQKIVQATANKTADQIGGAIKQKANSIVKGAAKELSKAQREQVAEAKKSVTGRLLYALVNGDIDGNTVAKEMGEYLGLPADLTPEQKQRLRDLAMAISKAEVGSKIRSKLEWEFAKEADAILKHIGRNKRSWFQWLFNNRNKNIFNALVYAGMLNGITTAAKNFISVLPYAYKLVTFDAGNLTEWANAYQVASKYTGPLSKRQMFFLNSPIQKQLMMWKYGTRSFKYATKEFKEAAKTGRGFYNWQDDVKQHKNAIEKIIDSVPILERTKFLGGNWNPYNFIFGKMAGRVLTATDMLTSTYYENQEIPFAMLAGKLKSGMTKAQALSEIEKFLSESSPQWQESLDEAREQAKNAEAFGFKVSESTIQAEAARLMREKMYASTGMTEKEKNDIKIISRDKIFAHKRHGIFGTLADILSGSRIPGTAGKVVNALLKPIVPFTNIVGNMADAFIDTLPGVGLAYANWVGNISESKSLEDRAYRHQMARATYGTLALAVLLGMAGDDEEDFLYFTGPDKDPAKAYKVHAFGIPLFDYRMRPELYLPIRIVQSYKDYYKNPGNRDDSFLQALGLSYINALTSIKDMSFLDGLADFFGMVGRLSEQASKAGLSGENLKKLADTAFKGILSPYIKYALKPLPTNQGIISNIDKFIDPALENRQNFKESVAYFLGLQSYYNEKRVDILGNVIKNMPGDDIVPLSQWLGLKKEDKANLKILNDSKISLTAPDNPIRTFEEPNEDAGTPFTQRKMTPKEFFEYTKLAGKKLNEKINGYLPQYKKEKDQIFVETSGKKTTMAAKRLQGFVGASRSEALAELFGAQILNQNDLSALLNQDGQMNFGFKPLEFKEFKLENVKPIQLKFR